MFCKKCGNEIGENEKFCTKCGTAVEEAKTQQDATDDVIRTQQVTSDAAIRTQQVVANSSFEPKKPRFILRRTLIHLFAVLLFLTLGWPMYEDDNAFCVVDKYEESLEDSGSGMGVGIDYAIRTLEEHNGDAFNPDVYSAFLVMFVIFLALCVIGTTFNLFELTTACSILEIVSYIVLFTQLRKLDIENLENLEIDLFMGIGWAFVLLIATLGITGYVIKRRYKKQLEMYKMSSAMAANIANSINSQM